MTIPDVTFDPTNPDPRCACILVLDTSGSMHGEKINQLNQGLIAFRDALQSDSVAQSRVKTSPPPVALPHRHSPQVGTHRLGLPSSRASICSPCARSCTKTMELPITVHGYF